MQLNFQGRIWEFDLLNVTVKQAMVVKMHTGMNMEDWMNSIGAVDPAGAQALFWVIKAQNGEETPIGDLDFPLFPFMEAVGEAFKSLTPEPDPTVAASSGE